MLVSTRVGTSPAWYNNIILKLDDKSITLSLIGSYLENTIMPDCPMVIKYTNEFFEYVFEGQVQDIKPSFPSCVTIQVKKVEELVNTRFFPRYDVYIPATIKPQWDQDSHFIIVNNVCLGGMAFLYRRELDYGEEAEVTVYISDKETVESKGKIIRKSQKGNLFHYSMQYTEMMEASNNKLADYLALLDEENALLQGNFFEHIKDKIH